LTDLERNYRKPFFEPIAFVVVEGPNGADTFETMPSGGKAFLWEIAKREVSTWLFAS
jgi:hypothetical protein